jgi:hypothetical protein
MSLAIDTDTVAAVLLQDGWHRVLGDSFDLDAYEFTWDGHNYGPGGLGFDFTTPEGDRLAGPINSILAVRYARSLG